MFVLKNGAVSTLSIIEGVKKKVQEMKATLPSNLVLTPIGDQSIFINAAIGGVVREGIIAAALTAVMILVFLGSWRSTLIIAISIPLSILTSIIVLGLIGETINTMTLGGLALAVGILVDDATVTIENIERFLEQALRVLGKIGQRKAFARVLDFGVVRAEFHPLRGIGLDREPEEYRLGAGVAAECDADVLGLAAVEIVEFRDGDGRQMGHCLAMRAGQCDALIFDVQFVLRRDVHAH